MKKTNKKVSRKWIRIIVIVILAIIIIAILLTLFYPVKPAITYEATCINSGGTITTQLCCKSARDFPNTCLIGACGCSPNNSHDVKVCDCGEGKCWDSKGKCVGR